MEAAAEFVQLRMPAGSFVLGKPTRRLGRLIDVLVEGGVRPPAEPVFRARAIARGFGDAEVTALAQELRGTYGVPTWHEGSRLAFDLEDDRLPQGVFDIPLAFQASFGPTWMHFSHGRLTLRAQALQGTNDEHAAQLRHALRLAKVRRQVRVVTVAGDWLRPWRELQAWRDCEEPMVLNRVPDRL